MADLDGFLNISVGGTSFQLGGYSLAQDPQVTPGQGRTGTSLKIEGDGWIDAVSVSALAAAEATVIGSFQVDGQSIVISGPGGVTLYSLARGACLDGGPHIAFTISPGDSMLRRTVKFTVTAQLMRIPSSTPGEGDAAAFSYSVKSAVRPDGLVVYTFTGTMTGPDAGARFRRELDDKRRMFPWPSHVISYEDTSDPFSSQVSYTITVQELAGDLPGDGDPTKARAVEGEYTSSVEMDEANRRVKTETYDLLVDGDPLALWGKLRGERTPMRESWVVTAIREVRLRATFTWLDAADHSDIVSWRQTWRFVRNVASYEERQYVGAVPVLVARPQAFKRLSIQGSATGLGKFVKPPDSPDRPLLEPPQISYAYVNERERETSWSYLVAVAPDVRYFEGGVNVMDDNAGAVDLVLGPPVIAFDPEKPLKGFVEKEE